MGHYAYGAYTDVWWSTKMVEAKETQEGKLQRVSVTKSGALNI